MSIFQPRLNYKPFEYHQFDQFIEAMWGSHWTHQEFNFDSDNHDFRVNLTDVEQEVVKRSVLMISQVEVAVKSYWASIGKLLPKPEIADMGAVFGGVECFDDSTEVLTDSGFKYFKDLTDSDEVAAYDIDSGEIKFEFPSAIIRKPYRGNMHHYLGNATDLMVTPNHRIIVINPHTGKVKLTESSNGVWSRNFKYPCSGTFSGDKSSLSDLDRLIIAIQADGSLFGATPSGSKYKRTDVCFGLSKERKINRLQYLLDRLNIDYTSGIRQDTGFTTFNFDLKDYLSYDEILKIKSFDYFNVKSINSNWGKEFIDELKNWDCTVRNENIIFYNSNEKAIDKVSIIATLSGYSSNKGINRDSEVAKEVELPKGGCPSSTKTCFALSLVEKNSVVYPDRKDVYYEGEVFCVTVSTGAVVVRRNTRTMISGNCIHSRAYSQILTRLGLNDEFQTFLGSDIVAGRVHYLKKYAEKVYDNDHKQILYSLVLFTLFTENVSLFSQFYVLKGFNRHRNILKDISNVVDYTLHEENCLIEGTEVLTPKGWVDLREIKEGDAIYQYWPGGGITEGSVLKTISKDFSGSLIDFHKKGFRCVCTPDHSMIYYNSRGELIRKEAKDLKLHNQTFIPFAGKLKKTGIGMTAEEKFRVALHDDGTTLYWVNSSGEKLNRGSEGGMTHSFYLKKERKIERLRQLISELGLDFSETEEKKGGITFRVRYNHDHDYKSYDWIDVSSKSFEWCRDFVDEIVRWDGYSEYEHVGYSSSKLKSIEKAQLIAILAGYKTNLYDPVKGNYKMSIMGGEMEVRSHGLNKSELPYEGKVYCVEVASHNIITRYKGDTFITGNCHAQGGIALINLIKEEHPELWDYDFVTRIQQEVDVALNAEASIIHWMLDGYSNEFVSEDILNDYIRLRMRDSLNAIGIGNSLTSIYDHSWIEDEQHLVARTDQFNKRPIGYQTAHATITEDSLFN